MIKPELADLSEIHYTPPKTVAYKFVNQVSHIESEGIRKIVVDDPSMVMEMLRNSIPPGFMPPGAVTSAGLAPGAEELMQKLAGGNTLSQSEADALSQKLLNENTPPNPATASIPGLPQEAAALMQQMMAMQAAPVKENPDAGLGMIRKRPEFLEKAIKEVASRNRLEVDIENSSVLDLFVNLSTKQNVIANLKTLSKVDYAQQEQEQIFYYTDVGISFYFDENGVINEIEIDEKYRHQTTKGLKIGDPLERAIECYGAPRMKSAKGAIWNRFSILLRDRENEIKLLRLKIRD